MRLESLLYSFIFYNNVLAHCNENNNITTTPTITTQFTKTMSVTNKNMTKPIIKLPRPTHKPKGTIPITRGNSGTLTYFTDSTFQCTTQAPEYALAVNPLLLGFTVDDWTKHFSNVDSHRIPWCGKAMKITVNGLSFTGVIVDTCDPVGNPFPDPVTGEMIGGKCDYNDVIDLYGEVGRNFLQNAVGDDFYRGDLRWELL